MYCPGLQHVPEVDLAVAVAVDYAHSTLGMKSIRAADVVPLFKK